MRFCLVLLFPFLFLHAHGQTADSGSVASISGTIFDSAYNFALQSATVAVYKVSDNALVRYQLTDNFGAFHIGK